MLKRLWLILGPVFCAMALVATLLFFYPINHKHNLTEEKKAKRATVGNVGSKDSKVYKVQKVTKVFLGLRGQMVEPRTLI